VKTHLKIKIKSLAAEARIIKEEERRWRYPHPMRESLRRHRRHDVRAEARHSLIAYGFLRGRRYAQIERPKEAWVGHERGSGPPDWNRVRDLVAKYGRLDKREAAQRLAEWSEAAAA